MFGLSMTVSDRGREGGREGKGGRERVQKRERVRAKGREGRRKGGMTGEREGGRKERGREMGYRSSVMIVELTNWIKQALHGIFWTHRPTR